MSGLSAREEVGASNAAFYAAIESGDIDAMRALWLDAPDALCVHPGAGPVRGSGPIGRSWALVMAHTPYIQFFLTDVEIALAGGDATASVASVTCTENVLTGDERTGPDAFGGGRAVATNVFLRTDAGWRMWIHHASPVLAGGEDGDP